MPLIECEQGSDKWRQARVGLLTASSVKDILTPKGDRADTTTARKRRYKLVYERLTGISTDPDLSGVPRVQRGKQQEPVARTEFRRRLKLQVKETGLYVDNLEAPSYGASPDGLIVGVNESLEIKVPEAWNHVGYLLTGKFEEHTPQIQMQMMVGGFSAVHFFSYCPGLPEYCRTFYRLVRPDRAYQDRMLKAIIEFMQDVEADTAFIRKMDNYRDIAEAMLAETEAEGTNK